MQFSKWVTLGFGALCLVAVAGVLNAQHLYYMSAILLTLPGVSYALGWYTLRGLEFARELPSTAWEGEEGEIVYKTQNHSRVSRFFLTMHEALPTWITPLDAEPPLFNVGAGDTARVSHRVAFQRRGVYTAQAFDVIAMDPLGVFAFTRRVPAQQELVVYPLPQQMRSLPLSGADRYGWQEFTSVALRGSSVDPDGVREYTPGDPLRRIHWRQTARTGKLSVIEFEETQSINLTISLDLQRGTEVGAGNETTLEYAVRLAASAAQDAIQQGATVRLLTSEREAGGASASTVGTAAVTGRGMEHLFCILEALARVEADSPQPLSGLLNEAAGHLQPGTTLLVITSRPDKTLADVLSRYTGRGVNVVVVFVDPETFDGGKGRAPAADAQRFFTELLAVCAHPFVLRHRAQNVLVPEAVAYADLRTTQSILA